MLQMKEQDKAPRSKNTNEMNMLFDKLRVQSNSHKDTEPRRKMEVHVKNFNKVLGNITIYQTEITVEEYNNCTEKYSRGN